MKDNLDENKETGIVQNPAEDNLYEGLENLAKIKDNLYSAINNNILMNQPVVEFLSLKKDIDALHLLIQYCVCSKQQRNTRKIYATNIFMQKKLEWRKQRLLKTKKRLINYGIIKNVLLRKKIKIDGRLREVVDKWLIEIVPLMNAQNISGKNKTLNSSSGSQTHSSSGSPFEPVQDGNLYSIENNNNSIKEDLSTKVDKSYLPKKKKKEVPERKQLKYSPDFEEFWQVYPPRGSKTHAFQEWQKLKPDTQLKKEIISAVQKNKEHETWENPKYIPHAIMYLKRRRWEDVLYTPKSSSKFNKVEVSPDKYSHIGNKCDV